MDDKKLYLHGLPLLSPFDGRETLFTRGLRPILSEGALHRYRAIVEVENLISLADSDLPHRLKVSDGERKALREIVASERFDSGAVAEYDHFGRKGIGPLEHDVKSVEVYLREKLSEEGLGHLNEFLHFPMTSEDVNNLAYNLMIRDAVNRVWLPKILETSDKLTELAEEHASVPVLGKTHGMNASPTTVGKRFAYTLDKWTDSLHIIERMKLKAKFSGPVGNHNAMSLVVPDFDMDSYARKFVESFGFEYSGTENQRISHQNVVRLLSEIAIMNTFGADFCDNIRHSVMMGWLYQEGKSFQVGSSVMPHKINPWFFEVGQGYFEIANRLIDGARDGLLMSTFERDLTDHPWERLYGEMFSGSLVGFSYISEGLDTLKVNDKKALEELKTTPEVLSEAVQIAGRLLGVNDIYMRIKMLTRGRDLDRDSLRQMIEQEIPNSEEKRRLLSATPETYIGRAREIAEETTGRYHVVKAQVKQGVFHAHSGIDAVLFDFDNTLQVGDKDELHARLSAISERMNMGYTADEISKFGNRSDYREMRNLMVSEYNRKNPDNPVTEDDFQGVNNEVSGQFDDRFRLAEGTLELLTYLRDNGYKVGLVTTRGSNSLPRLLDMHGIFSHFDVIINRDDCHERKPHPQPILTALERLEIDPTRAMYVGDKQVDDIIAGNAVGMTTVLVDSGKVDKYCAQPKYQVSSPRELLSVFLRR